MQQQQQLLPPLHLQQKPLVNNFLTHFYDNRYRSKVKYYCANPEKDPLTILCPEYVSIGNDICDESNDKLVCYYDGGDCSSEGIFANCTSFECFENNQFDPCPKYDDIGNGQCNKENFNLICSYDSGDCQVE